MPGIGLPLFDGSVRPVQPGLTEVGADANYIADFNGAGGRGVQEISAVSGVKQDSYEP